MPDAGQDPLLAAYRRTRWRGELASGSTFEIGIGDRAAGDHLLDLLGSPRAGILTAWNPGSQRFSLEENQRRNDGLSARLHELGLSAVSCIGSAGDHGEDSLLVPGLTHAEAVTLGEAWGQNCVVWWDRASSPALLVTRVGFAGRNPGELIPEGE